MGNKASLMLQDEEIRQISEETGFSGQQIEKLYSRFTHLDRTNCGALSKNDLLSIPELAINPLCERLIGMFFTHSRKLDDEEQEEVEEERINFRQFMGVLAAFRTNSNLYGQGRAIGNRVGPNGPITTSGPGRVITSAQNVGNITRNPSERQPKDQLGEGGRVSPESNRLGLGPDRMRTISVGDIDNKHANGPGELMSNAGLPANCLSNKLYFLFKIYDADNDGRISFNDLKSILKLMVGNYIDDVQLDKIATRAFVEVDRDNDGFVEFGEFCRVFAGKDMDDKLRVRFF